MYTKTEILRIGDEHDEREYIIVDTEGQEIPIKSIETIKVCGIQYFTGSLRREYRWNPSLRRGHRVPVKYPLQWFC